MKKFKYHAALIAANLVFGANYFFYSSLIGHSISSEGLYVLRTLSSALFFVPAMLIMGKAKIELRDIYKFALVAMMLVLGRQYLMLLGMNYTSPIDGSIIATMGPILIMIMAAFTLREKITISRMAGIVLGGSGALLLIVSNMHGGSIAGKTLGNVLLLLSIISSSYNTIYVKKLYDKYSTHTVTGWAYLIAAAVVVPVFGRNLMATDFASWTPAVYATMIYVLIIGTIVATVLYFYGLKGVSATASSIYVYTQPIVATALAVFRGQDKVTSMTYISAALIFAGVYFVIHSYKNSSNKDLNDGIHRGSQLS